MPPARSATTPTVPFTNPTSEVESARPPSSRGDAGYLEQTRGSVSEAWSLVFMLLGVIFLLTALYHTRFMPRSGEDRPMPGVTPSTIMRDFARTFVTFFRKPDIVPALLFMLFYRLPEAMCLKLVQPFLVSPREEGGLALSTSEVGFVNGTVGVPRKRFLESVQDSRRASPDLPVR